MSKLFSPIRIGAIELSHRVVLAPLTRMRADREQRRDAMEADPDWQAYRRVALEEDTLVDMENQILKPVSFSQPRSVTSQ
ncbi:NADH:flavin oxidoreductase/NADH oxidase family protein [Paraburkholderia sp. BL23I1N1]|uniref:NIPSNAP family protein n=1 Tax=Paraburkholderia sp. BL23I1N1 TaxID=1938802 RepID=UPI000E74FB4E|nr:NIPSNAP family protein [Paraburkholderia sp. BL23I1N1]RKE36549.1 NADH:flavin oxidoreductase/NADH oxidase family protein [Paraburkholderia sp. BL23I1N1]